MKRIALAVAVVVMAAGACKKAQNSSATPPADTTKMMADSMKMAPGDSTHMMADTAKAANHAPSSTPPAKKKP